MAHKKGGGPSRNGRDSKPEHLRLGVAPVAGRPAAFLVSHYMVSLVVLVFFAGASAVASAFASAPAAPSPAGLAFLAILAILAVPAFAAGLASVFVAASVPVASVRPPIAMISMAVRSARPPLWTRTLFFDL